jgi:hypothetical protein
MSYWPAGMKTDPIREWPGAMTRTRIRAPFSANLASTMEILNRETRALQGKNVRIQIAVPASKFRLDGMPYADAKAEHPGLILTLDSKHGPLSYPCDTFLTWQDNLRAIALALEALRKVDRYRVTKNGEQYRGFLAIEGATAMPAGFTSATEARDFVFRLIQDAGWTTIRGDIAMQLRQAKRLTHPDTGGTTELFQRVTLAEQYLNQNGTKK